MLRHQTHEHLLDDLWGGVAEIGPKSQKMVGEGFVCNQFKGIGEGKTSPSLYSWIHHS